MTGKNHQYVSPEREDEETKALHPPMYASPLIRKASDSSRIIITDGGTRTHDLQIRNPALCPTELRLQICVRRDSNPRPPD